MHFTPPPELPRNGPPVYVASLAIPTSESSPPGTGRAYFFVLSTVREEHPGPLPGPARPAENALRRLQASLDPAPCPERPPRTGRPDSPRDRSLERNKAVAGNGPAGRPVPRAVSGAGR